jgi:diacylglycerol kinase
MKQLFIRHHNSFKYAFSGIKWAFTKHINYRIHLLLSFFALWGGVFFHISRIEWMILVMTIVVGFVIETINTAIEETLNAIDKNQREDIKIAKDVSAAAMLIYSIGALIMSCFIFIPKIFY